MPAAPTNIALPLVGERPRRRRVDVRRGDEHEEHDAQLVTLPAESPAGERVAELVDQLDEDEHAPTATASCPVRSSCCVALLDAGPTAAPAPPAAPMIDREPDDRADLAEADAARSASSA